MTASRSISPVKSPLAARSCSRFRVSLSTDVGASEAINQHAEKSGSPQFVKKTHTLRATKSKSYGDARGRRRNAVPNLCDTRGGATVRSFIHPAGGGAPLLGSALACVCSTAAVAQWNPHFTASMGRGYGNIALSQSILSGTRRLGRGATVRPDAAPRAQAASLTPAQIDAALTYTADPTQSDRIRVAMIDIMGGQNPATREQMTKALADDVVLKEFDRVLSANGYSSRNVADDERRVGKE